MKCLAKLCFFLAVSCLLISLLGIAHAATESLSIEPGKEIIRKIDVASEDRIRLTFINLGQMSNALRFLIAFPNSTITDFGKVDQYTTSFTSNIKGICELRFDNTNSTEPVLVSLNYEITHYILGMPEMIFVLATIAVLLVVIVAGYIIMGKYT